MIQVDAAFCHDLFEIANLGTHGIKDHGFRVLPPLKEINPD
jgi:hypothetical protein